MGGRSNGRRAGQLNAGQIQCMLLVDDHLTSKEIALRLGISPHTVDQRIRRVLRATGAPSRRAAARLIKQRTEIDAHRNIGRTKVSETLSRSQAPEAWEANSGFRFGLTLPFATRPGQVNRMSATQRIFWIVVIAMAACGTTTMYLAGLESLARLIQAN